MYVVIGTGLLVQPNLPIRLLRLVLALAVLALVAVWLTRLGAPRPVAALPVPATPSQAVNAAAVLKVFGIGGQAAQTAGIELTGLYARANGQGFATFRTPRGPLSGNAGDEIQPGVRLRQVGADHVLLLVDGAELRLELPAQPSTPFNPAPPTQP